MLLPRDRYSGDYAHLFPWFLVCAGHLSSRSGAFVLIALSPVAFDERYRYRNSQNYYKSISSHSEPVMASEMSRPIGRLKFRRGR